MKLLYLSFRTWDEALSVVVLSACAHYMRWWPSKPLHLNYFLSSSNCPKEKSDSVHWHMKIKQLTPARSLRLSGPTSSTASKALQRHFDIWVHVASILIQRWVLKYSDSQNKYKRVWKVRGESLFTKLILFARIAT